MTTKTRADRSRPVEAQGELVPGLAPSRATLRNLGPAALYELAVARREGQIVAGGAFNAITKPHTGRSPNDKFVVREPSSEHDIWWGKVNQPLDEAHFDLLYQHVVRYLERQELLIQDLFGGAHPDQRVPVRFITPSAWHALFVHNMFVRPRREDLAGFSPAFTVLHAPELEADPAVHGTRTGTFIVVHFGRRLILIGGTRYAGEMKKSIFTILNYVYPKRGILSMHCSANVGQAGDTAIFFGLSGTGKTTLSADPTRRLIGDDEHGWADDGVFNFEGGCYAKVIRLSREGEPEIWAATRMFGTILENVVLDPLTREPNLDDDSNTENTRASYPIHFIPNHVPEGRAGHPRHIVFLTADAYGVLPPIARLSPAQAMYHYLSGYTAKVAGTERGVKEPQATFSTCFGAPFLPLRPAVYAKMLGERMRRFQASCWLVNTGWTGGPYGEGSRMKLAYTRAMVRAALEGKLDDVPMRAHAVFGIAVPAAVPGVPAELLDPRSTWKDPARYDEQAARLAQMFADNFTQFAGDVGDDVRAAGPHRG
ncbi:MAG TPA: phosphoenolpyruvate carboxykinase [Gemmatimonadales bacterium]|nr:phosphoenolpyruvate carboxykinase [Gemmatimonadales bacterium]